MNVSYLYILTANYDQKHLENSKIVIGLENSWNFSSKRLETLYTLTLSDVYSVITKDVTFVDYEYQRCGTVYLDTEHIHSVQ